MPTAADVRAQALEVAAGWSPPGSPQSWQLTAALFRLIAGHDDLLAVLAGLPADRLPALLASAAITYLVGRDRPDQLARYFPGPDKPQPPFDGGFGPAAAAFVSARLPEIAELCQSRRYQMNEVARCTQLALGIATVTAPDSGPVALVDLGTGSGLGLQLDRYQYHVGRHWSGPAGAAVRLTCQTRGPRQPPEPRLPLIASRTGIDISPVDLGDPAARAWLAACTPPEASALTRLVRAIEVTRQHPPQIVAGDVVEALPAVLAGLPARLPVLVTDAYLAVFLAARQRARLTEVLAAAARTRPVTWLSLDPLVPLGPAGRHSVQDLRLPDELIADYQQHGVFAVLGARGTAAGSVTGGSPAPGGLTGGSLRAGSLGWDAADGLLLARAHPSGQWVEWLHS